ncbi:ABC transporter permease [Lewinella sp. 4G2]|uniref:ABC transporter permease n=1 Tax=Lewinella sp. 4G2 TaxID=1803372 RepID=UPI0007B481C8|nr:ABC transporter permease [Lewinella sp. 4G2]OAV44841.1 hypothetical protein A3850_010215 [Lewinella sp. 4G2]
MSHPSSKSDHAILHAAVGRIDRKRDGVSDYRYLVRQLVRIDLVTEYRRSFLGLTWLILMPLVSVVIWILLNRAGVLEPGQMDIPYPAYVLLSTSIWGFFSELYKACAKILESNGRLLLMTPFPPQTFVVSALIVHLIRFAIPFGLNIIVLLLFGVKFTWAALLFPFALIPLLLLAAAIGLIASLLKIVAMDLSKLADEGIRLLMFLSPVVYSPKLEVGGLSFIIDINPLTYLISFPRELLTSGTFYRPGLFAICALASLLFFLFALRFFRLAEPRVRERLIAN